MTDVVAGSAVPGGAGTGYFAAKQAFNAAQGYRIDYKYLAMAYGIEIAVVATSLLSAWFFARIYGHNDSTTMAMMMLAPIAYAGVEIARVPLALALRTQPNWFWKLVFAVMVLCAVAVSVKSLSQLGEVMFRPRLIDVTRATAALKDAENARDAYGAKVAAADAVVAQRLSELGAAEARLKSANGELGSLPADRCSRVWHSNTRGQRFSTQECHADGRQKAMAGNLADAQAARADASKQLDAARRERDALDPTAAAREVSALEVVRRDAILSSQLHSFTGMFFGKDPTEVSEGELHAFLRIFVFFPAIFASLAATALALASVTPLKQVLDPVEIDGADVLTAYLAPLTASMTAQVTRSADEAVARALAARIRIEPIAPDLQPAVRDPEPEGVPSFKSAEVKAGDHQADDRSSEGRPADTRPAAPMRPTLVATKPAAPDAA